jgi:hypothetical protein
MLFILYTHAMYTLSVCVAPTLRTPVRSAALDAVPIRTL